VQSPSENVLSFDVNVVTGECPSYELPTPQELASLYLLSLFSHIKSLKGFCKG
jgi:hypothetical protein